MTWTQLHFLRKAIAKRITKVFHAHASMHAAVHGAKIKSLDELSEVESVETAFDSNADKTFEEQAFKRLREAQLNHGGR